MPGWISPWELAILLLFALLIFGPKKLPEMGRSMGKGMREFKESITGEAHGDTTQQAELPPAAPDAVAATTTIRDNDAI
jgi:sec-independent protein translocase protein TatA